jgi:hypothetical protein
LILLAAVLCVSRSAIIGLVLGTLVLGRRWPSAVRRVAVVVIPLFVIGIGMMVPGMVGTLSGLFTGAGGDSSVQSRTGSYTIAWSFIERSPWIGRGFGTFLPQYRILDNEYLLLFIEVGVVGVLCFIGLMLSGILSSERYRSSAPGVQHAQLAQALKASIVVGSGSFAFFDGMSFPIGSGLLFLLVGIAGAASRLTASTSAPGEVAAPSVGLRTSAEALALDGLIAASRRRWYVAVAGVALTMVGVVHVLHLPGVYWTQTDVVILAPKSTKNPNTISGTSAGVIASAGLVAVDVGHTVNRVATASAGAHLPGMGVRDGAAVYVPDTGGQWSHNFDRPVVSVEVVGKERSAVERRATELIADISRDLERRQQSDGTYRRNWITAAPAPDRLQVFHLTGEVQRAGGVLLLLGGWATAMAVLWLDAACCRRRRPRHHRRTPRSGRPATR